MHGKILIVDDVATNRIVLKVKLTAAGYQTLLAGDGSACLKLAREELPDLILLDLMLPDLPGTEVLAALRADPATRRIPVVMFSAGRDEAGRIAALRAGADDFLNKPVSDHVLLARLRSFLRARVAEEGLAQQTAGFDLFGLAEGATVFDRQALIGLVTVRPETALHLKREILAHSREQVVVLGRDDLMTAAPRGERHPDLYLIESDYDGADGGLRLMAELRSRPQSRDAAFCLLVPGPDYAQATVAYDMGANGLIDAAMSPQEMTLRFANILRRKRDADRMRENVKDGLRLAVIDPLTGLHNRRFGMAQLAQIAGESAEAEFAVMIVDLDRFKSVNDRFGHAAGDAVLTEVAHRLSVNLRATDLLARIGGEEFLVALPDTAIEEAGNVAARLCQSVEERPVVLPSGLKIPVTISIGLTTAGGLGKALPPEAVPGIVDQADRALMTSKQSGRNQVTIRRSAA